MRGINYGIADIIASMYSSLFVFMTVQLVHHNLFVHCNHTCVLWDLMTNHSAEKKSIFESFQENLEKLRYQKLTFYLFVKFALPLLSECK